MFSPISHSPFIPSQLYKIEMQFCSKNNQILMLSLNLNKIELMPTCICSVYLLEPLTMACENAK